MSPDGPASNIRVFVRWQDQVVFAGEEVKCTIVFKNAARTPSPSPTLPAHQPPPPKPYSHLQPGRHTSGERPRGSAPLHLAAHARTKPHAAHGLAPPSSSRGHRSTLSLTVPSAASASASASRARAGSIPWSPTTPGARPPPRNGNGHSHKRSVSIVSIGSVSTVDGAQSGSIASSSAAKPYRPARGHARASSLQIVSRGLPLSGPRSATHPTRSPNSQSSSPLFHASYPPDRSTSTFIARPSGAATAPGTPMVGYPRASPTSRTDAMSEFKFPFTSPVPSPGATPTEDSLTSPVYSIGETGGFPMRPKDPVPTINEHGVTPSARVLSTTSIAGTPRSSGEFYSLSNNSSETLASEYVSQQPLRTYGRQPHNRRTSNLVPSSARLPEALMMGYAQVQGSFSLDGSLVNLGPFEQVKRKGAVGGQGGGVIGVDTTKRDSGLLRGFGWGNFTSSIGELLGGGELSSIREMRGIANSKSVPLLSTPQSILFVDLQLGPGESKAFEYSFRLPRGLPPTHRGKAMKISYTLVIGTQRPGGAKEQQVKSVDIPFRVLGSVNSYGEILGHDLMSPYIILRDQARVTAVEKDIHLQREGSEHKSKPSRAPPLSNINSFVSYVDELLSGPEGGVSGTGGLLSPSATMPSSRRPSAYSIMDDSGSAPSAKDAIDLAIMRANMTAAGQQSANRFEIARNGRRIAVVVLARPAYRLGEVINMAIDFAGADIPCYAVHAALETAERVDPSLALRSEASIHRVTRKVWVTHSEATMYARRIVFNPTIPVSATPEFVTSGVSLEWKIKLEFVVPTTAVDRDHSVEDIEEEDEEDDDLHRGSEDASDREDGDDRASDKTNERRRRRRRRGGMLTSAGSAHSLLEEISRDDRGGLVLIAAENLTCESFEVAVPLRVYGAVCTTGLEKLERDEALEEGLVV
ncbi:Rgp1-domain-containing protein [Podospora didyma]|uniref:Rgp1-domain-containing protein n=1 Tax=Podospora didyma TaxID=330526 RepID=A0AAE0NTI3_9PEZI|nr:Rgp1-domain-containing protein [Podospora didyma]